jgi:hypothetical protein
MSKILSHAQLEHMESIFCRHGEEVLRASLHRLVSIDEAQERIDQWRAWRAKAMTKEETKADQADAVKTAADRRAVVQCLINAVHEGQSKLRDLDEKIERLRRERAREHEAVYDTLEKLGAMARGEA